MPKAAVNGVEIHYEVEGSGDPVMLITGLGGFGKSWGPQIRLFAREFTAVVPDHRGAGASSVPEDGYTIAQHATDMAETLRRLDRGPAHIVGSSTGGAIAQLMALDHADVVRSIVLCSSWGKTDDYFRQQFEVRKAVLRSSGLRTAMEVNALFLFGVTFQRDHMDEVKQWCDAVAAVPADVDILVKRIDMIIAHDLLARLPDIGKPALVAVGREDVCTPPYLSEQMAAAIPGAELAVLDGGHLFYLEHPEVFHDRIAAFLHAH